MKKCHSYARLLCVKLVMQVTESLACISGNNRIVARSPHLVQCVCGVYPVDNAIDH